MPYYNNPGYNLLNIDTVPPKLKSLQDVNLNNDDEILSWIKRTTSDLSDYYSGWFAMCRENVGVYSGQHLSNYAQYYQDGIPVNINHSVRNRGSNTNYISSIVETHVARLTSSRPAVNILPVHSNEHRDKSAAKTSKQYIETTFKNRRLSDRMEHVVRHLLICGSAYLLTHWNPDIGDVSEETGERMGDVDYKLLNYNEVMLEPTEWECMDWIIRMERVSVDRIIDDNPHLEGKLSPNDWQPYDLSDVSGLTSENRATTVLHIYHRATKRLPEGLYIKATRDVVLEVGPMPYPTLNKAQKLPIVKIEDIKPPGQILPLPLTILEAAKGSQYQINQLNRLIARDINISAPKWLVMRGSVSPEHINNQAGIINYTNTKPDLVSKSTVRPELFEFRKLLVDSMYQNTGAFKQSFGGAAPNTRAGVMLEFHEEQEFKRAEPLIKKVNNFITEIAENTLMIAGDYYNESDKRYIKMLGDHSGGVFRRFKASDLHGNYDISIERGSALPESKEGRLRWIQTMVQLFPGQFDWEQAKKALDFASDEDLRTAETSAYEMQCLELDLLVRGEPAADPQEYQDHISHLKALYPTIDSVEFAEMPQEVKKAILRHTAAHEMYAWSQKQTNPIVAYRLRELKQFPKVFVSLPKVTPPSAEAPVAPLEEGGAPRGNPIPPEQATDVKDPNAI